MHQSGKGSYRSRDASAEGVQEFPSVMFHVAAEQPKALGRRFLHKTLDRQLCVGFFRRKKRNKSWRPVKIQKLYHATLRQKSASVVLLTSVVVR